NEVRHIRRGPFLFYWLCYDRPWKGHENHGEERCFHKCHHSGACRKQAKVHEGHRILLGSSVGYQCTLTCVITNFLGCRPNGNSVTSVERAASDKIHYLP